MFHILVDVYNSLYITFQALANMLKYSLDENDKEDGVNIEVIGDNKIASPSMPPTSVDE
jgi:ATP-dependent Clp protease ATP-binding subunit ClpC